MRDWGKERDRSGWRTATARSSGFRGGMEWAGGQWWPDRRRWARGRRRVEEEERKKRKAVGRRDLGSGAAWSGRRGRHDLGWPWLGWVAGAWHRTMGGVEVGEWAGAEMRLARIFYGQTEFYFQFDFIFRWCQTWIQV